MKTTITVCFKEDQIKSRKFQPFNMAPQEQMLLEFKPLFESSPDDNLMSSYATKSKEEQVLFRIHTTEVDEKDMSQVIDMLKDNPDVEFYEVNELYETKFIPNDPEYPNLYGLDKIACERAWKKTEGSGITVAVLDTGVDYNHPDIKDNMWSNGISSGYNFSENNNDPMDNNGHGSHVAGTIGAVANNNIGIVGVAPKVKIMAVKIFPNAYPHVIVKALKYAVDNGAKIINNSWGPTRPQPSSPTIEAAIDYVHSKGGICVFAAGNSGDDTAHYSPANYHKTIAVGATDRKDQRPRFSNYGSLTDVYAPGVDILSLKSGTTQYTNKNGTSMACPHVAGAIALLLSLHPQLTFHDIVNKLKTSSDVVNGLQRLNCENLLK